MPRRISSAGRATRLPATTTFACCLACRRFISFPLERASLISGGSTRDDWVSAAPFSAPAAGTFGSLGRNDFRAPGISQLDLALAKEVSISERMRVLRADAFNVFNRAQYGAPSANLSKVNFGEITTTISSYPLAEARLANSNFPLGSRSTDAIRNGISAISTQLATLSWV